jgi:hypothetical protein
MGPEMDNSSVFRSTPIRDLRVDAIRGFVLIWMTWSHVPPFPLRGFMVQTFGIVSAAEVFVFASGLVMAWLLQRLLDAQGSRAVVVRAFTRAGQLYITHLAMLIVLLSAAGEHILKVNIANAQLAQHIEPGLLLRGACLIFQPYFLDILPMYVCFLLAAPLVLTQLAKGRVVLVGTISFGVWIVSWYVPVLNQQTFNVLSWQFMFISGMIAGHWRLMRRRSSSLPPFVSVICCAIAVVFVVLAHPNWFGLGHFLGHPLQYDIANRHLLTPVRLLNFGSVAAVVVSIPRTVDAWIPRPIYRGLILLGQSSLHVFVWSVGISYLVRSRFLDWQTLSKVEQFGAVWIFALSLFIPALFHRGVRKSKKPVSETTLVMQPTLSSFADT